MASSKATETKLRAHGIPILDLNAAYDLEMYFDGADECNSQLQLIKGGGGAATREKIIAACAKQFICLIDEGKWVQSLGAFPIAIEVLEMARSYVGRCVVAMGGNPMYRESFVTDNGHIIIDAYGLNCQQPIALEEALNNMTGVVSHGLFAKRGADVALVGSTVGQVKISKC